MTKSKRFKCGMKGCKKSYKIEKEVSDHRKKHHAASSIIRGTY